jgi:hypothetical protein
MAANDCDDAACRGRSPVTRSPSRVGLASASGSRSRPPHREIAAGASARRSRSPSRRKAISRSAVEDAEIDLVDEIRRQPAARRPSPVAATCNRCSTFRRRALDVSDQDLGAPDGSRASLYVDVATDIQLPRATKSRLEEDDRLPAADHVPGPRHARCQSAGNRNVDPDCTLKRKVDGAERAATVARPPPRTAPRIG